MAPTRRTWGLLCALAAVLSSCHSLDVHVWSAASTQSMQTSLTKVIEHYRQIASALLKEFALDVEQVILYNDPWSALWVGSVTAFVGQLKRTQNLLLHATDNSRVALETLLHPLVLPLALPNGNTLLQQATDGCSQPEVLDQDGYASAEQILAHLFRDWSAENRPARDVLLGFVVEQGLTRCVVGAGRGGRVLVPGAGAGRLAFELALLGYHVTAVEASLGMVAVAASLLQTGHAPHSIHVAPFATQRSGVESRVQAATLFSIPDCDASALLRGASGNSSLTLVHGAFPDVLLTDPELASCPGNLGGTHTTRYHAVVTAFFLDAVVDPVATIGAIWHLLEPGGVWINVGPLHYHHATSMPLGIEELQVLAQAVGFTVVASSVRWLDYLAPVFESVGSRYRVWQAVLKRP